MPGLVRVGACDLLDPDGGGRASAAGAGAALRCLDLCSTCKQRFTGQMQLQLAIALWSNYAHEAETDNDRLEASSLYAMILGRAGEHAEAARLKRGILDVETRTSGPEHRDTLVCVSNWLSHF